jgi:branched-subunit amino acid ABC-type transport system permease component
MYSIGQHVGFSNTTFWLSLVLASLAVAAIGAVIEIAVLRPIYSRPLLTQLIVTFGLVLVIAGVVRGLWGSTALDTDSPPVLDSSVAILDRAFPVYQLFLAALAAVVFAVLWLLLYRTRYGRTIRAAVSDPELLSLSGANVPRLFTTVFAVGAFFAGLAGASVAAQGAVSVGMDVDVIVRAFIIVVIGGMGSLGGALVGSLLVGLSEALVILWLPSASLVSVFVVLVVVLVVRPQGLFGSRRA